MAGEITITGILKCFNSTQSIDAELRKENLSATQTGDSYAEFIQTVGTSEEALELGQDIGTLGYTLIINLDSTNFVSLRRATGEGNCIRLDAGGGFALFKWAATAPFVIADTAPCRIKVLLLEA